MIDDFVNKLVCDTSLAMCTFETGQAHIALVTLHHSIRDVAQQ